MNLEFILKEYCSALGLKPGGETITSIIKFLDLIYEKNLEINLVSAKSKEDIFIRHFLDCISIFSYFKEKEFFKKKELKLIDVGSGPGLPGILIGALKENFDVTLIDSRKKYIEFLNNVLKILSLGNVKIIYGRAEEIAHQDSYREKFDIVTARAVARVDLLSELTIPLTRIGGRVVMYKSRKATEELDESRKAISVLGAEVESMHEVTVPLLNEYRVLIILNKTEETRYNYPRKYARIKKIQLG
jgi:16S rRNA (guanine527-N7)-methyltransferase